METKIIVKVHFTIKHLQESEWIKIVKEIEFKTVKEASDFKQMIKLLYEKINKTIDIESDKSFYDDSFLDSYRILVEKLIGSDDIHDLVRLEEKCEIIKQTRDLLN